MTILKLLETHTVKRPWSEASRMRCKCGEVVTAETEGQLYALHRAHLAEVLDKHMQEQCYEAWSAGWHDSHYQHTANNERRGQGHPAVAYSNPYRAAQLKDQP